MMPEQIESVDRFEFKTAQEIWENAKIAANTPEPPAYFVSQEQIYGEPKEYGPYSVAFEAQHKFEHTHPTFDGAGVTLIKVAPTVPWVTPKELMDNVTREEWEINVDPETKIWGEIYDKSTTVVARVNWEVTQDQAGLIYHNAGRKYEPEFLAEVDKEVEYHIEAQREAEAKEYRQARSDYGQTRGDRLKQASVTMREIDPEKRTWREPDGIDIIYASEWHQGFGSECKEHLGRDQHGQYYYALEQGGDDDLSWNGPYIFREEAEERLSEAYDRWDARTGQREQAWEDHETARLEKEEQARENASARDEKEAILEEQMIERETGIYGDKEKAAEIKRRNKISDLNARDRDYRTVSDADRVTSREARKDQHLRDNYEIGERRIEQLESWVVAAISKPSMSREQRLQGLELVEQRSPSQSLRVAVERICPSQSVEQGQELEIPR